MPNRVPFPRATLPTTALAPPVGVALAAVAVAVALVLKLDLDVDVAAAAGGDAVLPTYDGSSGFSKSPEHSTLPTPSLVRHWLSCLVLSVVVLQYRKHPESPEVSYLLTLPKDATGAPAQHVCNARVWLEMLLTEQPVLLKGGFTRMEPAMQADAVGAGMEERET